MQKPDRNLTKETSDECERLREQGRLAFIEGYANMPPEHLSGRFRKAWVTGWISELQRSGEASGQ